MSKLKITLGVLVSIFVLLLLAAYLLPTKWKVERSIMINAPPAMIYPFVANLKTGWAQWSSFDYEDPNIQYSYSGPEEGAGASRTWISKSMGNGLQTITKADPNTGIEFELKMEGTEFGLQGSMTFIPENGSTKVTWVDYGEVGNNPIHRYMAFFMDKMMGKTFETSLNTLKSKVESQQLIK